MKEGDEISFLQKMLGDDCFYSVLKTEEIQSKRVAEERERERNSGAKNTLAAAVSLTDKPSSNFPPAANTLRGKSSR